MDINPFFRDLALAQGVPIGGAEWTLGGPAAYSGTTGVQASYGWLIEVPDEARARAIVANYASRPIYWMGEPLRFADYDRGCQPMTGAPGPYTFANGAKVYGLDWEHCWITPLSSLARKALKFKVPFPWNGQTAAMDAAAVARFLLQNAVHSILGMVRNPWVLNGNPGTERTIGLVLNAVAEASHLGCLDPQDEASVLAYCEKAVLPKWESAIPFATFDKPQENVPAGTLYVIPAQIAWATVGMRRVADILAKTGAQETAARMNVAANRARLEVLSCVDDDGSCPWVTPVVGGKLAPQPFGTIGPGYDVGYWCARAIDGSTKTKAVFDRFNGKTVTGDDPARWLVHMHGVAMTANSIGGPVPH
jgi:hypothetical protein